MKIIIIIDGVEYNLTQVGTSTETEVVYNDWRLPTIKELLTLVNYERHEPCSDLEDTKNDYYWASTTHILGSRYAWYVGFSNGGCGWFYKSNSLLVRCVRDGLDGLEWSESSKKTMAWDEALEYAKELVAPVYYKG